MSEYQYYEFAALDRPLTPQQQAELRNHSTRATINSSRFINEYHWGSLKGDPFDWMVRYFDAHVYLSSWGQRLMLRLPRAALDAAELAPFVAPATGESGYGPLFSAKQNAEHWILDWDMNDDSGEFQGLLYDENDGPGWTGQLLPLRDELLRGDTRPLYLGWLARASKGEYQDTDLEPPLPAGLGTLSAAQQALVQFLLLDPSWLMAAAASSPAIPAQRQDDADMQRWLQEQTEADMRASLRMLLTGRGLEAERALRRAYLAWQHPRQASTAHPERRSVAQIHEGVASVRLQQLERERLAREAKTAQLQAEHAAILQRLVQEAPQVWQEIDATLERGSGAAYAEAFKLLQTLAQALQQANQEADFRQGLAHLLERHGSRPAWRKRLEKAGWA